MLQDVTTPKDIYLHLYGWIWM